MGEDVSCRLQCHESSNLMTWDEANSQHVIQMVQHEYFVHLLGHFIFKSKYYCAFCLSMLNLYFFFRLIDNLPAATRKKQKDTNNVIVYQGYRLGGTINDQVYINNYLKLILSYHKHGELVSILYTAFCIIQFQTYLNLYKSSN